MTLSRGFGYCVTCKTARRIYNADLKATTQFAIHTGECGECNDRIVRVYPNDNYAVIPEVTRDKDTRKTYSGEQEYSYNRGYFTPEGTRAEYKNISVYTLLNDVSDSIDVRKRGGENGAPWARIIETKAAASHFDAVLSTLIREGFRMPVVMWDQYRSGDWIIGNGHHRITAAILLGLEMLPVVVSYGGDYMRAEDSSDDEENPIDASGRTVWQAIRNVLPRGASNASGCVYCDNGYGCEPGCCVDHASRCEAGMAAKAPQMPATGTATREGREAKAAAVIAAQGAAGQAVYDLIQARRRAQRDARDEAARMREEIERMIERAAMLERDAIKIDSEVNVLWALYDKAANITVSD